MSSNTVKLKGEVWVQIQCKNTVTRQPVQRSVALFGHKSQTCLVPFGFAKELRIILFGFIFDIVTSKEDNLFENYKDWIELGENWNQQKLFSTIPLLFFVIEMVKTKCVRLLQPFCFWKLRRNYSSIPRAGVSSGTAIAQIRSDTFFITTPIFYANAGIFFDSPRTPYRSPL